MGRCAVAEGVVHGGELLLHVLLAQTHQLEGFDHDLGVVVTDSAGGKLHAVAHQIVLVGVNVQGIHLATLGLQQHLHAAVGHGERVVAELQLAGLVADLVHGEVHDPAELVALLVHVTLAGGAEGLNHHARGLGGVLTGSHHHQRVGLEIQHLTELVLLAGDKLGDAAGQLAVLVHLEPVALGAGLHLAVGQQLFDLLAGQGAVGDVHHLHGLALESLEFAVGEQGGDVLAGQVDAQVGLIGAVGLHGVVVGDAAEGCAGGHVVGAELGEDGRQHVLQHGEHVVLGGEGHLHIQLIELAGGAITAGILVAEAGCDLEVAVKAGGHQQLLELLGRLRQRVELAGMLAGGHQIVAGALGGTGGQDGGGDFQEAVLGHGGAESGHHLTAQDDILLHGGVAQVKEAVLETGGLIGLAAAVDLEGQGVVAAAAQHLDLAGNHLDIAGGLLGVLAGAFANDTLYGDGGLLVETVDDVHHLLVLHHHLGGAVEVAQHHKGEVLAHGTDVFHPAHDLYLLAYVFQAQLVAGMCTHLHHTVFLLL